MTVSYGARGMAHLVNNQKTAAAVHQKGPSDKFDPSQLFGRVLDKSGTAVNPDIFSKQDVALLFSANWDQYCREFEVWLKEYLVKHPKKKIIMVPTDHDAHEYSKHRARMDPSWYAMPFQKDAFNDVLKRRYAVWTNHERIKFGISRNVVGSFPALAVVDWDKGSVKKLIDASFSHGPQFWTESLALWDKPDQDVYYGCSDLGHD